jgi:hypothetical protein
MKKLIALALLAIAPVAFAGTTATLTISGTVAPSVSISLDGGVSTLTYSTLNISGGESDKTVATATEVSNDKAGYRVTLQSANAGSTAQAVLKGTTGNTDSVNYTIKYGGSPITLASGVATVTDVTARTAQTGVTKPVSVTLPASWVNSDTYSDTLTLSIVAK